uniref:Leucine-rich repeat-containing N-terminal plant-type domain-containing protein n=1 Tax=Triticum urartu TaxID=4572 RepID=A0A8R7UII9_TRIUA
MRAAPMAVRRAAILLLLHLHLHLMLFHAMAAAAGERRAGTIVRQQQRRRQVLLQEKATLLALKRSLTLLSPSPLADWNESNGDVCGLTGVACDWRRQHVIGLSLGDMNISGAVPPVIGNLTRLKSLDMSSNFLAGQIPAELSNLRGSKSSTSATTSSAAAYRRPSLSWQAWPTSALRIISSQALSRPFSSRTAPV